MHTTAVLATCLQILAALLMAFIWAAFLRKLDIFKPEKWGKMAVAFAIGCIATLPVLSLQRFAPELYHVHFAKNPALQSILFYTIDVGLVEEVAKFSGFFIFYLVFKKWFNEDINFIVYASLVALGFATVENCLYFAKHGIYLVYIRGLMSTFSHMIDTALVAAVLCVGLRKKWYYAGILPLLGIVSVSILHGMFDSMLTIGPGMLGFIASALIFMLEIELWAQFSNNFLNRSAFYKNNIAIDRNTLQKFLISAFIFASLIQFTGLVVQEGWKQGLESHLGMLIYEVVITFIIVTRVTRFTVKPGHWEKIYPRLPFKKRSSFPAYVTDKTPFAGASVFSYSIRGDEFNEYPFTSRINRLISLIPFKSPKYNDNQLYNCWIVDKVFLGKKKELYYLCELAGQNFAVPHAHPTYFLIKPKLEGTRFYKKWPIIGIITIGEQVNIQQIPVSELRFLRWSVFKDEEKESFTQTWKEMIF